MGGCSIRNCKFRSVKGGTVSFFSIPAKQSVANEWLRYCKPDTKAKNGRVCSNHFVPSDYNSSTHRIKLKPDAIPTLHLPLNDPEIFNKILANNSEISNSSSKVELSQRKLVLVNVESDQNSVIKRSDIILEAEDSINIDTSKFQGCVQDQLKLYPDNLHNKDHMTASPQDIRQNHTLSVAEVVNSSGVVDKSNELMIITVDEYEFLMHTAIEHKKLKEKLEKILTKSQMKSLKLAGQKTRRGKGAVDCGGLNMASAEDAQPKEAG